MPVKDFRELNVYKSSFAAAVQIQQLSKSFPVEERYSLTDQIRRSSRSICANLAEAWRKRRYPNSFVSKINDAESEASETLVWLDFALEFGCMPDDVHAALSKTYDVICSQLSIMAAKPEQWTPRSSKQS